MVYVVSETFWNEGVDGDMYEEDAGSVLAAFSTEEAAEEDCRTRTVNSVKGENLLWLYRYVADCCDNDAQLWNNPSMKAALKAWRRDYKNNTKHVKKPPTSVSDWLSTEVHVPAYLNGDVYKHMADALWRWLYTWTKVPLQE